MINVRWYSCFLFLFVFCSASCSDTEEIFEPVKEEVFQPSDTILLKPYLKVLDIGNSYTNDATAYLPYLVEHLGVDVDDFCLYKATMGGASFRNWYQAYNDLNSASYKVSKVIGNLEVNVTEGSCAAYDGSLFRQLLREDSWDVILVHQVSRYATDYEGWWKQSATGYLGELLDIIQNNQPDCAIGFLLVHSPDDDYETNVEQSSLLRWEHIASATQRFVQECKINIMVPYGTAIENLRATELNNVEDLTRDGYHLGFGLARYTAACCYYEALLAPRTGVSILGKSIPYIVNEDPSISQYSVTESNMETAQKAAVLACRHPYTCSNPEDFLIEQLYVY